MNGADAFFDTNILIYLIGADTRKIALSRRLVVTGGAISVQVLNEFVNVARRKRNMSWDDTVSYLGVLQERCRVVPLTLETHDLGVAIAKHHRFSIYDAMIVAAAQLAGCRTLYSENLQHGRTIGGVRIVDPYRI